MDFRPSYVGGTGCGQGVWPYLTERVHVPEDLQHAYTMVNFAIHVLWSNMLRIRELELSITYYPQLAQPDFWDYKPDRPHQPATPQRQTFYMAPDEIQSMTAIWFPEHGALGMKLSHLIHHSKFVLWLSSFRQLYIQTLGYHF